jgi:membrane protein DedA with SNARE-associated domain
MLESNDVNKNKWLVNLSRVLLFILVMALSFYLFTIKDQIQKLSAFGYPGIFLVSLLTNASLFLPIPAVIVASTMGAILNPIGVAVAAGTGAALGELSGYVAGFSGQAVLENSATYEKITLLMKKYGNGVVFLLAFIPNPLFDAVGIIAGVLKMPVRRFLFWCLLGKILKMLVFAYGGSFLVGVFTP